MTIEARDGTAALEAYLFNRDTRYEDAALPDDLGIGAFDDLELEDGGVWDRVRARLRAVAHRVTTHGRTHH